MKDELEKKLAEAFPFMQIKETLEEQEAGGGIYDLYGAFGCECDDGWYELLYGLCGEITEAYKKHGAPVDQKSRALWTNGRKNHLRYAKSAAGREFCGRICSGYKPCVMSAIQKNKR